jgi:hypothetical protein
LSPVVFAGLAFSGVAVLMALPNTKGIALHESLASAGAAVAVDKEEPAPVTKSAVEQRQRRTGGLPAATAERQPT